MRNISKTSLLFLITIANNINMTFNASQSGDNTVFFFTIEKNYEPIGFVKLNSGVTHLAWSPSSHVSTRWAL